MFQLILEQRDGARRKVTVNKESILIGRSKDCDLPLSDPTVSSKHASITKDGEYLILRDLESSNGVFVNKKRIRQKKDIIYGDLIQIGPFRLTLLPQDTEPASDEERSAENEQKESLEEQGHLADRYDPFEHIMAFLKPIEQFLLDKTIKGIMINGHDQIFVERNGVLTSTSATFKNEESLNAAVRNIGRAMGIIVDRKNPRLDTRLQDGSRIHAVLAPVSRQGTCVMIRKILRPVLSLDDLINRGTINREAVQFIDFCLKLRKNIVVSGSTAAGKTTILNALGHLLPREERIILLEHTAELQVTHDHLVHLETQLADKKGEGNVDLRDLLDSALRLRPDWIIIGDFCSDECLDVLQAMSSGQAGFLTTFQAPTPEAVLTRFERMANKSCPNRSFRSLQEEIVSAVDLIIHLDHCPDGSRKISQIAEVGRLSSESRFEIHPIFILQSSGATSDHQEKRLLGPTGQVPSFADEGERRGLSLPKEIRSPASQITKILKPGP